MHSVFRYLWHWLTAVNDHSLQAPFVYDFYSTVLRFTQINEDMDQIEIVRKRLEKSNQKIDVISFGAKSRVDNSAQRSVAEIAKKGITTAKTSQLLNQIIKVYNAKHIFELGTSLGLNTMYLAIDPKRTVSTFEGCPNTMEIAKANFLSLGYKNIESIIGNIDETLPQAISNTNENIDFAYIDANHQLEPTLEYFELLYSKSNKTSVFVFDDIHWSSEMSDAWATIVKDERVTLSIDLFDLGVIFFNPELNKQHYKIRY